MTKNDERAAQTKGRLIEVARALFASEGYAQTGTEAILTRAGVKRGALYHHFKDKADLFEAVCRDLTLEAFEAIAAATADVADPFTALEQGSIAWIEFMARPESRRILVVDAPGVLGAERWEALDRVQSYELLRSGVTEAMAAGAIRFDDGPEVLAILLNGAMNQIALRASSENEAALKAGFLSLLRALRP